jgi:drug/metabolite transporter (DMT)-like permease
LTSATSAEAGSAVTEQAPVARAALWMLGALLSFLAMALGGRELSSAGLSTFQILLFRSIVGLAVVGLLALRAGSAVFKTQRLGLHTWRNIAHFGGQFGWFFAIAAIPLAEVFAIEFTIPIWTALMAAVFLADPLTRARVLALALGVAGVLLILRPGLAIVHPAALAALLGAIGYAVSHVITKQLTSTEAPLTILFFMTLVQLPLGLVGAAFTWHPVNAGQLPWTVAVGLSALSAHYCLARALRLAPVNMVMPMDFLRLPLVAVLGYVLYGERIDAFAVAGTALILLANVANLRRPRAAH